METIREVMKNVNPKMVNTDKKNKNDKNMTSETAADDTSAYEVEAEEFEESTEPKGLTRLFNAVKNHGIPCIEGLLSSGEQMMIHSTCGSRFAEDLALCFTDGSDWLGMRVYPKQVAYLTTQLPFEKMSTYLEKRRREMHDENHPKCCELEVCQFTAPMSIEEMEEILDFMISAYHIEVLIIDNLPDRIRLLEPVGHSEEKAEAFCEMLNRLMENHRLACIGTYEGAEHSEAETASLEEFHQYSYVDVVVEPLTSLCMEANEDLWRIIPFVGNREQRAIYFETDDVWMRGPAA